jgi:hypothetical protein
MSLRLMLRELGTPLTLFLCFVREIVCDTWEVILSLAPADSPPRTSAKLQRSLI